MSAYRLALFLHVLGAIIFFAGMTVAGLAWESARRRQDPREAAVLLRLARTGALLVGSGTAVVLFAGLWLVELRDEGWPAWLVVSLALFAVSVALGGLGGGRPRRARELAERLAATPDAPKDDLRALLDDRLSRGANYAALVLSLVILALMVWQPGG